MSDGYIVLTAVSAAGNHLWYFSGAMYLAVINLPNIVKYSYIDTINVILCIRMYILTSELSKVHTYIRT